MAAREIVRGVLLITLFIAPAVSCGGETVSGTVCRDGPGGEKVSGTVFRDGPCGASHKRFLTPFLTLFLRPASLPADFTARVDGLFAKWNRRDTPGCAVGIVHRGQVIYSKGFGSADLEYQAPNTAQTVFEVMAFSPPLT